MRRRETNTRREALLLDAPGKIAAQGASSYSFGIVPVILVFVLFLGGCDSRSRMSDEEITRKLIGTWVADEMKAGYRIYGETDFHRDGVQSGNGVVHTVNGTTTLRFSGDWSVRNGHLLSEGEMRMSSSGDPESYQSEDMIERVTDNELILVNAQGVRTIRHKKGQF